MKICPKCKKEFDDARGFCGDCGVALVESAALQNPVKPSQQVTTNSVIVNNISKLEGCTMSFYSEVAALVKENRLGRGSYAILSILRLLILDVLTVLIMYNELDKLFSLSNLGKGMSTFPSLPSATPLMILTVVNFVCIIYLMMKRLKDMGLQMHHIQFILGGYGLMAAYAVWSINHGIDTIISAALKSSIALFGKSPLDLLMSANDIVFAVKMIAVLYALALIAVFFKGTNGRNEYGEKSISL